MVKKFIVKIGFFPFIDKPLIRKETILELERKNKNDVVFTMDDCFVHESWVNYWKSMGYIKEIK
ncbi:MAG: hypothetical protein WCO84_01075 [bacterium]